MQAKDYLFYTLNSIPMVNEKIKIALFTDADVFAGTEQHMLTLAMGLNEQHVSVRIACPSPSPLSDKAQTKGISVIPIAKCGLVDLKAIRILRRLLKSGSVDIIHCHNGRTMLQAAIAVKLAGRGRCVATQHFIEPHHVSRHGIQGLILPSCASLG